MPFVKGLTTDAVLLVWKLFVYEPYELTKYPPPEELPPPPVETGGALTVMVDVWDEVLSAESIIVRSAE